MGGTDNKSALTSFGQKCREERQEQGKTLFDQAKHMKLLPSDISAIEAGERQPPSGYIENFGQWLGIGPLQLTKFTVLARPSNVIPFPRTQEARDTRKLFRKVNKLSPEEIRRLKDRLKD